MADEKKGQLEAGAEATAKEPTGLKGVWEGDFFQKGMEKLDEAEVAGAKKSDEECPECVKERKAREEAEAKAKGGQASPEKKDERKPLRVVKADGKMVPLYTEEEIDRYLSMGINYTNKSQALAEEKREIEKLPLDLQAQLKRFDELAGRLENGLAAGTRNAAAAKVEEPPEKEVPLEEEFGYDPEIVDPAVPKLAATVRAANKKLAMLEESNKLFFLDKVVQTIQGTLTQAVKEFPIENIKDEAGNSVTWKQFVGTFKSLIEDPANNQRSIPEMAMEAVKVIHLSQKTLRERTAEEAKSEALSDDIPLEEVKAKHPKLFERISDQAVAEHAAKAGELPPTPKSRGTEANAQKAERKHVEGRKFSETMDDAFSDPEVLAGIGIHQQ